MVFENGCACFCEHKSIWYKAHVRKSMGGKCLIHFDGWNDKHDRWVGLECLRPINYEFEAVADTEDLEAPNARGDATVARVDSDILPGKKKAKHSVSPTRAGISRNMGQLGHSVDDSGYERIKLSLPRELKDLPVSDWEQITREPRQ